VVLDAQPVLVTASAASYLRSVAQRRTSAPHGTPRDPLVAALRTTAASTLLLVDAAGGGLRVPAGDLPSMTARQRGVTVAQLLGSPPGAELVAGLVLDTAPFVVTVSASGAVKRTAREEYEGRARTMVAAGVRSGDRIVAAVACGEDDHLLLAHDGGFVIRFPAAEVRPMGRSAAGVSALKVPRAGRVVALSAAPGGGTEADRLLTLARDGSAKRSALEEYPVQGRGGKGVQAGAVPLAWCGLATDLHVPTGESWTVLRAELVTEGRRIGRAAPATEPVVGVVVPEW
jgi:DNA gyrase subunit A